MSYKNSPTIKLGGVGGFDSHISDWRKRMFYKVVSVRYDNLNNFTQKYYSAYVIGTVFQQEYKVDEFVFAEDGRPFMVFDDLEKAKKFKLEWGDAIFQCEVVNPRKYFNMFVESIKANWGITKTNLPKYSSVFSKNFIRGTVFCDGVRLRRTVN